MILAGAWVAQSMISLLWNLFQSGNRWFPYCELIVGTSCMGPCCVKPRSGSVAFQTNFWLREGCANPSYPGKGMNDFLAVGDYCDEGIHHLLIMGTSCMKPGTGSVAFQTHFWLREGCATGSLLLRVACSKKNNRPFIYNHTLRIPGGCPTSTKEPSRREKWWTSQLFSHTFAFLEAGLHKMDITFEHPSCCAIIFSFKFVKLSNILFKKGCAIPGIFFIRLRDPIFSSFCKCWLSISLQWQ